MKQLIILLVVIFGCFLIFSQADAACRSCVGDSFCESSSPSFALPGTYNCSLSLCNDCIECGCVDTPSPTPPPTAPSPSDSSGLFPIVQCGNKDQHDCTICDIFDTISRVMNIIILFGFAAAGLFLVIAGIMMFFGGANMGLLRTAKNMIRSAIIGVILMLVSYLIVFTIIHMLSGGAADTYFNIKEGGFRIDCNPDA